MAKAFEFLPLTEKPAKPREKSIVEIRGSYYSPVTIPYMEGLFELAGDYIDGFKFAGGSMRLHSRELLKKVIDLCHKYDIYVSTGGFIERIIADGKDAVDKYLLECKEFGFDVVEISSGLAQIPLESKMHITKKVIELGLKPKPEIAFMIGAGAGTQVGNYEASIKLKDLEDVYKEVDAYKEAGATFFMFESEGITEDLPQDAWRTDFIDAMIERYGLDSWMFEAADPAVFKWYLKNYGKEVNVFIDHSQIIEFEAWRSGLWGDPKIWEGKDLVY